MGRGCLAVCMLLAGACMPDEPASETAALPSIAAPAEAAGPEPGDPPRYFGKEAFTVVMDVSGPETGTVTYHYRDWGRRRAEITRTTSTRTANVVDRRMFTDGVATVTVNNLTGEVQASRNPPRGADDDMRNVSPDGYGAAYMAQRGGEKTGETATIAGQACEYWTALGARACVAPWGPTLHAVMTLGDATVEQKAVEVRIGDGGPDEAFRYEPPAGAANPG